MNQHQRISQEMTTQYELLGDAILVSPSGLAHRVFEVFATGNEEPHIQYTSVEHLKQMAREFLRKRNDPDSDDSVAYMSQSEIDFGVSFSGTLQPRYPLPRKSGEEPLYIRRGDMTPDVRAWNVAQLRKSARSRLEHADALEAEGRSSGAA